MPSRSSVRKSTKRCKSARFSGKRSIQMYAKILKAVHKAMPQLDIQSARKSSKKLYKRIRKSNFTCYRK